MVIFPGCKCCSEPCDVTSRNKWGVEFTSFPAFQILFPSGEHCVRFEVVVTVSALQTVTIQFEGFGVPALPVYSGSGYPTKVVCVTKPADYVLARITVSNYHDSAGYVQTDCEACDCNPAP